jgi:hypothetical protein
MTARSKRFDRDASTMANLDGRYGKVLISGG